MSTSGHSGVDRAVQHLIPALARRGYPVDLLKVRRHGPNLRETPPGVRVIDLGTRHTYTALPAVARYLRRERPAVMLSDKDRVNRTAFLARWLSGAPTRLVFSQGTTISLYLANVGRFERWLQRASIRHLYPWADNFIVTCAGVADDMAAYTGIAREHVQVVESPVVPERLFHEPQPRPIHPWFGPGEPPVIVSVGELSGDKDQETLLRAFARVRARRACRLLILGEGKLRGHLLTLAAELGVADDFALPGFDPNPYPFMAHAAVFGFTSRREGLGFVVIEALAVGTPVVSTDCPSGPREILQDGKYGTLVPMGDVEATAAALSAALDGPRPPRDFLREAAWPYEIERATSAYLRAMGLE